MLKNLLLLLGTLLAVALLLEGGLRLLPVCASFRAQPVDEAHPVFRYEPGREATWSRFPDFRMRNTVRVNNAGFVNDADYDPAADSPLAAVIGDSFVEAFMVPFGQTITGSLAGAFQGRARVYSFAASGMPLSQYLAYADHARRTYAPKRFLFVVVGNDFDESVATNGVKPGAHQFVLGSGGAELVRSDYQPSPLKQALSRSALVRYLALNCDLAGLWARQVGKAGGAGAERFVGNVRADADEERLLEGRRVADEFLARLPGSTGVPMRDVLLVVDGLRPSLYDGPGKDSESYFGRMRAYLMDRARANGIRVVDMQRVFAEDYARRVERFEFSEDGHWNGLAHGLAARAALESGWLDGFAQ
ncbi:MAG: hypothetical protein AB7D51_06285 [Desulfovibrionaceae bacterium]